MGYIFHPVYGEDLGSAIENAEEVLSKIKSNKFDKTDLAELSKALASVVEAIETEIAKNED